MKSAGAARRTYSLWRRWGRAGRLHWLRVLRQPASTAALARGLALGVFIAFMPIIPFQIAVIVLLAIPLRANKVAAVASSFICNAVNMIPFYYMLYLVGRWVAPFETPGFDPARLSLKELLAQGWDVAATMFVGGFALGIPCAAATYLFSLRAIGRYRRRRAQRLHSKRGLAHYDANLA